jgi:hypothetical protein
LIDGRRGADGLVEVGENERCMLVAVGVVGKFIIVLSD